MSLNLVFSTRKSQLRYQGIGCYLFKSARKAKRNLVKRVIHVFLGWSAGKPTKTSIHISTAIFSLLLLVTSV